MPPSYSHQLDISITDPTIELYEFRRLWPASFTTLVTNYLGFLTFTSDDVDRIRNALVKEAKSSRSLAQMTTTHSAAFDVDLTQESASTASKEATKRRVYTPQKSTRPIGRLDGINHLFVADFQCHINCQVLKICGFPLKSFQIKI